MYEEIIESLRQQLTPKDIENILKRDMHLGIFSEPYLSYMLQGKKTIESRFSKNKVLPYNNIKKDDIVIVKKSSGNVMAYFEVKDVIFFDLNETFIDDIKAEYNDALCVSEEFWELKKNSNYATLIIIDNLVILKPFSINKKGMQTWIKLK